VERKADEKQSINHYRWGQLERMIVDHHARCPGSGGREMGG